jgi:hypothetical protein
MRYRLNRRPDGSSWTALDTLLFFAAFNLTGWTVLRFAVGRLANLM